MPSSHSSSSSNQVSLANSPNFWNLLRSDCAGYYFITISFLNVEDNLWEHFTGDGQIFVVCLGCGGGFFGTLRVLSLLIGFFLIAFDFFLSFELLGGGALRPVSPLYRLYLASSLY